MDASIVGSVLKFGGEGQVKVAHYHSHKRGTSEFGRGTFA